MATFGEKYAFYCFLYLLVLIHSTQSQGRKELCAFNVQARYTSNQDIRITWSRFNNRCGNRFHIRANNFSRSIIQLRRNRQLVNEELVTSRSGIHILRGVKNAGFVYFICSPTCDLMFQFNHQRQIVQLTTTSRRTKRPTTTVNTTLPTTTTTTRRTTLPYIPPYPRLPAPDLPQNEITTIIASTELTTSTELQTEIQNAADANVDGLAMPDTGIIIGALIGLSGLILGCVFALIFYRRNRQDQAKSSNYNDTQEESTVHIYDQSDMPYSTNNDLMSGDKVPYQNHRFVTAADTNKTLPYQNTKVTNLDKNLGTIPYQNEKHVKSSAKSGKLPYQNERFGSNPTSTLEYEFAQSKTPAEHEDTEDYLYPVIKRPESESYDDVEVTGDRSSYEKLQANTNTSKPYDRLFATKR